VSTPGLGEHQESSDERDPDDAREIEERERWLRDNIPPHHG
jgi:hypothetical protein